MWLLIGLIIIGLFILLSDDGCFGCILNIILWSVVIAIIAKLVGM